MKIIKKRYIKKPILKLNSHKKISSDNNEKVNYYCETENTKKYNTFIRDKKNVKSIENSERNPKIKIKSINYIKSLKNEINTQDSNSKTISPVSKKLHILNLNHKLYSNTFLYKKKNNVVNH